MIYLKTHFDMDGAVCAILLNSFIPNLNVTAIGYNRLNDEMDEFIYKHKISIITDLSLDKHHINNMILSKNNILYIDHHKTSIEHKDKGNDKVKIHINEKFCAAGNVLKYFKDKQKFSESLKTLAYLTNDYDLWQLKEPESQVLNFIFWERKFNAFCKMFKDGYDANIVKSFLPAFDRQQLEIDKYLKACEQQEITHNGKRILFIVSPKYISDISLKIPDYDYYFIVADPLKISIRSKDVCLTPMVEKMQQKSYVNTAGCHENAGGINLNRAESDSELMDQYYELMEILIGA